MDLVIHNMMTYKCIYQLALKLIKHKLKLNLLSYWKWDYDVQMYFTFSTEINQAYICCSILKCHDDLQICLTIRTESNQVYIYIKFVVIFKIKWWLTNLFNN